MSFWEGTTVTVAGRRRPALSFHNNENNCGFTWFYMTRSTGGAACTMADTHRGKAGPQVRYYRRKRHVDHRRPFVHQEGCEVGYGLAHRGSVWICRREAGEGRNGEMANRISIRDTTRVETDQCYFCKVKSRPSYLPQRADVVQEQWAAHCVGGSLLRQRFRDLHDGWLRAVFAPCRGRRRRHS